MLEKLVVHNYRCFEQLELMLRQPDEPGGGWTILVGENGTGKSSLLQAVVVGLLDPRPLTSLYNTPWQMCRHKPGSPESAQVQVDHVTRGRLVSHTKSVSPRQGSYFEQIGHSTEDVPLVLGFSARRRIAKPGELPETENVEVERVRGLFDPNLPLLAHDAFSYLKDADAQREFAKVVRDVIVHQLTGTDSRMFPLVDILELKGRGGIRTNKQLLEQQRFVLRYGDNYQVRVGVSELSDGYQAMLSMVLEILIQAAIASGNVPDPQTLSAVVLIDEIEAHLHPRWQRTVVPLLREVFPRCQFLATTHSPLVVGSAQAGEVQVLEVHARGDVRVTTLERRMNAIGAEEIYDLVFEVPRTAPPDYVEQERQHIEALAGTRPYEDPAVSALVEAAWRDRVSVQEDR